MALTNPALLNWHIQQRLTGGEGIPGVQSEMPQKTNMRPMPGTGGMVEGPESTPMRPIGLPKSFMPEEDPNAVAKQMMEDYNIPSKEQMQEMYPENDSEMVQRRPAHISYPGTKEEILARQAQEIHDSLPPEVTAFGPGQGLEPIQEWDGPTNAYEESQDNTSQNVPYGTSQQDPIASGAQMGSQIAKQSYGETDEERRRALGHAMMQFFSNYASSKNPSNLGSINEAFSPAQKEFSNQTQLALKARQKAEEMAMKEKEMQLDREYKMGMLGVNRDKYQGGDTTENRRRDDFERKLNQAYLSVEVNKEKELNNFIKDAKDRMFGEELDQAIEKKRVEIDKKYSPALKNIQKQMDKWGLTYQAGPDQGETVDIDNIDFASLTEDQLRQLGAL